MAVKDALMVVLACFNGNITIEGDDFNYTNTKK
jgi:hypothetical protein